MAWPKNSEFVAVVVRKADYFMCNDGCAGQSSAYESVFMETTVIVTERGMGNSDALRITHTPTARNPCSSSRV